MIEQQGSQLLPGLFTALEADAHFNVLLLGPAQPETVAFFSDFRCTLYVNDLFAQLPLTALEDDEMTVQQRLDELLVFPDDVRFSVCLFWDVFNYLDSEALSALMLTLRPYLAPQALAHCFGVHNTRSAQRSCKYSIVSSAQLAVRPRSQPIPGYAPHSQGRLKDLLQGFDVQRSVLLADSRLELLLRAKAPRN